MFKKYGVIFQKFAKIPNPIKALSVIDEKVNALKKLNKLAQGSARVLIEIKTVFPFNFFTDYLIIDELKVTIHTSYFFYTKEVRSIEYKDILNVIVQEGVIFAKLEIIDRFFTQHPSSLEYLKKKEAIEARRVIQGMIIAKKENIDTQKIPANELLDQLERIGQSR